jgi:hypothetical protein
MIGFDDLGSNATSAPREKSILINEVAWWKIHILGNEERSLFAEGDTLKRQSCDGSAIKDADEFTGVFPPFGVGETFGVDVCSLSFGLLVKNMDVGF